MPFKKVFAYFYFVVLLLTCLIFPKSVFAQAEPASGCSGWLGDIALRGVSWHHRGIVKGVDTQIDAGFKNPSGSWEPATYIYYGEGGLVSTGGQIYLNYTWWAEGAYLVRIYNAAGCYFERRLDVADIVEDYGNRVADNVQTTVSITRPGKEICGTLANYTQSVSALPAGGSAGFSMGSLGTNYNLYRGQPGGDSGVPWMTTPLTAGQSSNIPNYSVNYKIAGVSTNTASWTISPLNGATASWGINNLKLFLDCKPNKGSPPPVPTPACPTITSSCSGLSHFLSGIPLDSYYYLVYRSNGASSYWSNQKTWSTYTDATVPCGTSYEYDVKPSYDNSTPLNNCQQNKNITCPCGPTNTPTPTVTPGGPSLTPTPTPGVCVPACPSRPQPPIIPADLEKVHTSSITLRWTAPTSWGKVCSGVENNHYHLYASTTGVGPSGTLKDSSDLFLDRIDVSNTPNPSYTFTLPILTEGQNYYWQVFAANQ